MVVFVGFLLQPTKVKPDDINELQYRGAKICLKHMGKIFSFERNIIANTGNLKKHRKIAKGCPEYISSVVKVSSCSYQNTFFINRFLSKFEFLNFVIIRVF